MSLKVNQLVGFGAARKGNNLQFVGGKTATKAGAASGNSTLAINSGLTGGIASAAASGDLVVAAFSVNSSGTDLTLLISDGTTNYTLISELYSTGTRDINLRVAYKIIGADTDITFGPTQSTTYAGAMAAYVFRGAATVSPIDGPQTATGTASGYADPPNITPSMSAGYIVCVGGASARNSATAFTSSDLEDFLTAGVAGATLYRTLIGVGHNSTWTGGSFDAAAFGLNVADDNDNAWAAMSFGVKSG